MNIEMGSEWRLKNDHFFTCKVLRIESSGTIRTDIPSRNNKYDFAGGFCDNKLFLELFEPVNQATVKQSEPIPQGYVTEYVDKYDMPVKQKHGHYYKDVSHLSKIDVYSVCRLFNVTDPEISHAVKKLLCLGQRGLKDRETDMQNVIDTLQRWQELEKEFAND